MNCDRTYIRYRHKKQINNIYIYMKNQEISFVGCLLFIGRCKYQDILYYDTISDKIYMQQNVFFCDFWILIVTLVSNVHESPYKLWYFYLAYFDCIKTRKIHFLWYIWLLNVFAFVHCCFFRLYLCFIFFYHI